LTQRTRNRFGGLCGGQPEGRAAGSGAAILMTATTEDKMIPRNPCQIRGAGVENPEERPVLSLAEVFELADRMKHPRYRALILLGVRDAALG
jgi:hypothetical protein